MITTIHKAENTLPTGQDYSIHYSLGGDLTEQDYLKRRDKLKTLLSALHSTGS